MEFLPILTYCLPAVITGLVAYFFFDQHLKNEEGRRRFLLHKDTQKQVMPIKLQAYERMVLYLERIDPSKLLLRVTPNSEDKSLYEELLVFHIEHEFEHNLAQQIYVSEKCWSVINTAKNTTIQNIRRTAMSDKVDSANKLREVILTDLLDKPSPSNVAISFIKSEVNEFLA